MQNCVGYLVMVLTLAGCVAPRSTTGLKVVLNNSPDAASSKELEAVWLAYLLERANYIKAHEDHYRQVSGNCAPQFDEEVKARASAAKVYAELSHRNPQLHDPYFIALIKVEKAGYIEEYVWRFLRQPTWPETQQPTKLRAFHSWASVNIPDHQVLTIGSISIQQQ